MSSPLLRVVPRRSQSAAQAKPSMKQNTPSRTALTTALIRAHHSRLDGAPLIHDLWGDRLVPDSFRTELHAWVNGDTSSTQSSQSGGTLDGYLGKVGSYASVIFRARFAEDALAKAICQGVRQYVQIGAGFDSYALRRPPVASEVAVYELDHPSTQQLKLQRLVECGVQIPDRVHFVGADLGEESLKDALRRAPFRFDEPAFFSWLGVTVYLTREANLASLKAIAECGTDQSSLVFTYTDERALRPDGASESFQRMRRNAAALGEPFLCGFDPKEMPGLLAGVGFEICEDLSGIELAARYERPMVPPLVPSPLSRVVLARVAQAIR